MKKIICTALAFFMISASVFEVKADIKDSKSVSSDNLSLSGKSVPTLDSGNIIIEAEDMGYSSDAKIISDSNASGGYALTCANKKYADAPEEVENVTMSLKINVPESQMGRYRLWCRLKTPAGGISYFYSMNDSSNYQTQWFATNSDYYWIKLSTINLSDGTFEYNIKYRDYAFRIDKFVITNNNDFKPVGKDDVPGVAEPTAPLPPFTPPAGVHPRVLFRSEDIPKIKENAKHPVLATMYSQVKQRAFLDMDCHMPDNGGVNNVSIDHVFNIQCRALMYALGEADENHAKQTVQHMKDMYDTLVWSSANDITRQMGAVLATSGCVYDWCFDVLTEEDKDYFILQMKRLALKMEIGFPAGMGETFAGHGGEGELFYFQSTAGIAIYDEDPQMYNAAAGVLYEYMFETRKAFNASGIHPAGSAYGPVRAMWEVIGQLVFERMGDESVMGNDFDKIPLTTIHMRQPNGMYVEDGDTWIGISSATGPTYQSNDLPLMVYSSYYDNPYVYGEAVKQLSIRGYNAGSSIYDNGVLALLFLDPNKEFAYPDDYGKEEPLTHFTSYPITTMNARTSWRQGMLGETAQVFVNGQEKLVGDHDHEHSDIGSFSIYYKGLLTSGGGTYSGEAGGWGIPHYYNYYRRTVSKNCVTVYDPNETFGITGYPLNYDLANDGGQRFEENSKTYDEFVSHKDHARTDSVYAGPNRETPEFSYLKTDLTNAYSDKITGYTRSTVALNLFSTDYPLAFICYDNISSSDETFKKTWNLQSIDTEPVTEGNITTIERNTYGYTGKLVVQTMIPEGQNAVFTNVGGQGKESFVDGVNYDNWETYHEQGLWRLELSPKEPAKDDVFLNAMYVTDKTKNLPALPMTKYETEMFYGVGVMDRLVFFSKQRDMTSASFTLSVPESEYEKMSVLVTDVAKGKWQVSGTNEDTVFETGEDENVIYLRLSAGDYTFTKVDDAIEAVKTEYPRDERVLRAGDVLVYNTSEKRFSYTQDPTAARDNHPFLSEDDFRANGALVTVSGNQVTLTRGTLQTILTIGSKEAIKNGVPHTNETAPFIGSNGKVYISPLENSKILGMNVTYDSFSRILKVRKTAPSAIAISSALGNAKAVAGSKVVINTESTYENSDVVYYCNGVKYEDNKVVASAGTNTVYAQAIEKTSGKVLATSASITFEAYDDDFKNTFSRQNVSGITSGEYIRTGNLFPGVTALPRLYYQSADITLADGQTYSITVGSHITVKNSKTEFTGTEVWPVFFKFTSDYIQVTTSVTGSMARDKYIVIPRTQGDKTYNIKTIYDPLYGSYILLVDDVIYSVIDVSASKGNPSYDLTPGKISHNGYGFMYLQSADPGVFSNYKAGYSEIPENHSRIVYINNENSVSVRNKLTGKDDLIVNFTAIKGDFDNVLCIATVLETDGELVSLATHNVMFDSKKDSEQVSLKLENLPSGIAEGGYTVNVMLWDAKDYTPIVSKIVMPNN